MTNPTPPHLGLLFQPLLRGVDQLAAVSMSDLYPFAAEFPEHIKTLADMKGSGNPTITDVFFGNAGGEPISGTDTSTSTKPYYPNIYENLTDMKFSPQMRPDNLAGPRSPSGFGQPHGWGSLFSVVTP